jgi:hypothetical protein
MMQFVVERVVGKRSGFFSLLAAVCFLLSRGGASAQTVPVIHWVNDTNQNGYTTLTATSNFITSFKATNDVHVTVVSGNVNSIYQEVFGGLGPGNNNPAYLTNFIGLAANGTGDGIAGHIKFIEGELGGTMVLQFDFAVPLTSYDRFLITDVDLGEAYRIQAFSAGQPLDLTGWSYAAYSGEGTQPPDDSWPIWSVATTNGTLAANTSGSLTEPLSVLTPNHLVDRVVITRMAQGSGSIAMQFLSLPIPSGQPMLQIQPAGTNIVLTWPGTFNNYALYSATNLASPVVWTAVPNPPSLNLTQLAVTNSPSARARFYRLQLQ